MKSHRPTLIYLKSSCIIVNLCLYYEWNSYFHFRLWLIYIAFRWKQASNVSDLIFVFTSVTSNILFKILIKKQNTFIRGDKGGENLLVTHKPWSTFWEIEKRSSSFYNGKEGTIWKVMKCLVVSFQKEPECTIQEKLMTSRSLNRKK